MISILLEADFFFIAPCGFKFFRYLLDPEDLTLHVKNACFFIILLSFLGNIVNDLVFTKYLIDY